MCKLQFSPIYDYATFITTIAPNIKGVYVWGFRFPNKENIESDFGRNTGPISLTPFLPYYVGKNEKSIVNRIKDHYNFNADYHIFKRQFLHVFYKYYKSDKIVENLSLAEYKTYDSHFAYLNQGNLLFNGGKAKNSLKATIEINKSILSEMQFYQEHFYACCISIIDGDKQTISDLERHINFHVPHILIGKPNAQHFDKFQIDCHNLGADNFYYNFDVKGY